jgi:hypothetical protein
MDKLPDTCVQLLADFLMDACPESHEDIMSAWVARHAANLSLVSKAHPFPALVDCLVTWLDPKAVDKEAQERKRREAATRKSLDEMHDAVALALKVCHTTGAAVQNPRLAGRHEHRRHGPARASAGVYFAWVLHFQRPGLHAIP